MEDICYLGAVEMARAIRTRELGVREVVDAHIARIQRVNPAINAIVTTTFDGHGRRPMRPTRRWRAAPCPGRCLACRWRTRIPS